MKKMYTLLALLLFVSSASFGQSLEELKAKQAELKAQQAEAQATADSFNGEIGSLQKQIDILTGWTTGFAGNIGFDLNSSNNWIAAPNPDASSQGLGIGLSAFANKMTETQMFRNKGIVQKAWQKVTLKDDSSDDSSLFDNGTADILNLSSLYGYRIHPKVAISALGELNTSLSNFLAPGTADIGAGVTWTPTNNFVVVVHPVNYHIAWPADGTGIDSQGALGAKLRADYTNSYTIAGKTFNLSSTLSSFLPYSDKKSTFTDADGTYEAGLFEYTWLNNISFELFRGIGVGVGLGLRGADFESRDPQSFYNIGLSYNL